MSQVDPPAHTDTKEVLDAPTPLHGEISLDESIHRKLQGNGDKEALRQLLRKQLEECGWVDAVTDKCREALGSQSADDLTVQQLLEQVRTYGRQQVPDAVKVDLLRRIKAAIAK